MAHRGNAGRELTANAAPFVPGAYPAAMHYPTAMVPMGAYHIADPQAMTMMAPSPEAAVPLMMPYGASGALASIEVYDAEVKANVHIPFDCVFPSYGAMAYMQSGGRSPNKPKVCPSFVSSGVCRLGETCRDVHPMPQALMAERSRVYTWMHNKEAEFINQPGATYKVFYSDLKEVISVPSSALVFTRGLFLDPMDREKRPTGGAPGRGGGGNPTVAQQAPTACGLFAANPSSCKWGRFCNQAHVSSAWIEDHRRQFELWSSTLESQFQSMPADACFTIHDPLRRALIKVPKGRIATFTRGLLQGTTEKCPSVCLLSLNGRCTAGGRCNQAHVDPQWLSEQTDQSESMLESVATGATGSSPGARAPRPNAATHAAETGMMVQATYPSEGVPSAYNHHHHHHHHHNQQQHHFQHQHHHHHHPPPADPYGGQPQAAHPQYQMQRPNAAELPPATQQQPSAISGPSPPNAGGSPPSPMHARFSQNPPPKLSLATPTLTGGAPSTPPDAGQPLVNPGLSPIRPPGRGPPLGPPGPSANSQFQAPTPTSGFAFRTPDMMGYGFPAIDPNDVIRTPLNASTRAMNFSFPAPGGGQPPISPLLRSGTGPAPLRVSLTGFEDVFRGGAPDGYFPDAGDSLTALPPSLSATQGRAQPPVVAMRNSDGPHPLLERGAGSSLTSPPQHGAVPPDGAPLTPLSLKSPSRGAAPRNPRYSPAVRPSLLADTPAVPTAPPAI